MKTTKKCKYLTLLPDQKEGECHKNGDPFRVRYPEYCTPSGCTSYTELVLTIITGEGGRQVER